MGYVPAFSLDGSATDVVMYFALVLIGTYIFSWLQSGIWLDYFKRGTDK